jgi:hypothetical protein
MHVKLRGDIMRFLLGLNLLILLGPIGISKGQSFQCVKGRGEDIVVVTAQQAFVVDEVSGSATEIPVGLVGSAAFPMRRALWCPAWERGSLWLAWTGRAEDGKGVAGVSNVAGQRDIVFDRLVSTRDWVFLSDGGFLVLGISPDSDHSIYHFDSDGTLLSSFLGRSVERGKLADARIFLRDRMITVVFPYYYEALDLTLAGEVVYRYELSGDTFIPRAAFQDADGTVFVELVSGDKKVTHEGIVFVNPGLKVAALRHGVMEIVKTIPPEEFPRQPIRSVVSGRFIAPPATIAELGQTLPGRPE